MNFVAVFPEELRGDSVALLEGARAQYFFQTHRPHVGRVYAAVVLARGQGSLEVISLDESSLKAVLKFTASGLLIPALPVIAIVAVPRPQMVKRVLLNAAMFGVSELHFIRSENVEKSYLQATCLAEYAIQRELILGIEQSGSCNLPRVQLHQRFNPFVDFLSELEKTQEAEPIKLIAHTDTSQKSRGISFNCINLKQKAFIAIGPEAGWNEYEVNSFQQHGFTCVNAGPRVLRVDTAFVYYLSLITQNNLDYHKDN